MWIFCLASCLKEFPKCDRTTRDLIINHPWERDSLDLVYLQNLAPCLWHIIHNGTCAVYIVPVHACSLKEQEDFWPTGVKITFFAWSHNLSKQNNDWRQNQISTRLAKPPVSDLQKSFSKLHESVIAALTLSTPCRPQRMLQLNLWTRIQLNGTVRMEDGGCRCLVVPMWDGQMRCTCFNHQLPSWM